MDAKSIEKKYTRVAKINNKWDCYLQIDHQCFCIVKNVTKRDAVWYRKMISIALERLLVTAKNEV